MNTSRSHSALFAVVILAVISVCVPMGQAQQLPATGQSAAAVPRWVQFSGVMKEALGKPIAGVTFALYKDQEGGAPIWMETQNVPLDESGRYSVLLGATKNDGLPMDLFTSGEARWLGVQSDGQPEQPRVLLLSVPYALKAADAETLGGMPASSFVRTPSGPESGATAGNEQPNNSAMTAASTTSIAAVAGSGTKSYIPMWTSATALGNSLLFQSSAGNVGLSTTSPTQKFEVVGNILATGPTTFTKAGDTAFLYVGDINHPIEAIWDNGLAIGAYKAPEAIFIADFTGNVGIGTTTPTVGILNTVANSKSVVGISAVGWNASSGSGLSGTDGIHATGGNGDPNSQHVAGGAGAVFTGGIEGGSNGYSGPGIVANGGNAEGDFGAGDGVNATGGNFGGIGVVASGGFGADGLPGPPGVLATGGPADTENENTPSGSGIAAVGGAGSDETNGGDGINAIAGAGAPGCSPVCTNGLAGSFTGDVSISGNLNVSGTKSFKIDHPLDPANKYLYHAALESSEVLNLYSGNVALDANGEATVQLPLWFEALNRDFRYQLTAIGSAAPNMHVAQEIQNHSFRIAGGAAGIKVSWQVTGIRQDAWEKAHPMEVEVQKPQRERGYYINPELFGAPAEKNMDWARIPQVMKRIQDIKEKQRQKRPLVHAKFKKDN